ncbi:U-Asilidin(12)-Dg3b-like [Ruditapes philippinarum]|uniref:U-Asilidin(12)-Dg3b-like n=1 Tax=Ruditapes philippinarum TaxID=129788 RepID=UPI00295BBFC9|nr:U-Asilidin(12)-Dg3b-like [Ruditapes philippinarum]
MFAKVYLVVFFVCIMAGNASAKPTKRTTCEFWGSAGCATHCIALNHTGGWCDSKNYCHCKKETIFGKREKEETA